MITSRCCGSGGAAQRGRAIPVEPLGTALIPTWASGALAELIFDVCYQEKITARHMAMEGLEDRNQSSRKTQGVSPDFVPKPTICQENALQGRADVG